MATSALRLSEGFRKTESDRITRADFERFVDGAFEAAERERADSRASRFREAWNGSAKTRFFVGAGLIASSAIAAASGAALAAGSLLAARAALSAVGGYFASDAAFDLMVSKFGKNPVSKLLRAVKTAKSRRELDGLVAEIFERYEEQELGVELEKAKRRASLFEGVKRIASVTVASVLALVGGSSAAEAATSTANAVVSETRARALSILDANQQPVSGIKASDVIEDVRRDHPGQKFVTLEQSVRRIEGLSQGIGLKESAKLSGFPSVSNAIHDPSGKIATAMKDLGYMDSKETVSQAAKRLTEGKIAAVLEKAYGTAEVAAASNVSEPVVATPVPSANPAAVSSPSVPASAPEAPVPALTWIPRVPDAVSDLPQKNSPMFEKWGLFASGAAGTLSAVFGWIGVRELRQDRARKFSLAETPELFPQFFQEFLESPELSQRKSSLRLGEPRADEVVIEPTDLRFPNASEFDKFKTPAVFAHAKIRTIFTKEYGFSASSDPVTDQDVGKESVFSLMSPNGARYVASFRVSDGSGHIKFACVERGETVGEEEYEFSLPTDVSGLEDMEKQIEAATDALAKLLLRVRDIRKQREFSELKKLEIPSDDLFRLYRQFEVPDIFHSDKDIGGHWFTSPYYAKNGTFRFEGLATPESKDAIGNRNESEYFESHLARANNRAFSPFERKFSREFRGLSVLNWYKHAGKSPRPSWNDLNDSKEHSPILFGGSEVMRARIFAVATRLDPDSPVEELEPGTYAALPGWRCGGSHNYVLSFWKALRISGVERSRRMAAVEKLWASESRSLGLMTDSGDLALLDKQIRIPELGTFGPDVAPVRVDEVR